MLALVNLFCYICGMKWAEQFRREVANYIERSGIKPTTFGRAAINDPAFVGRLLGPEELNPRISTIDVVREWMAGNPPKRGK